MSTPQSIVAQVVRGGQYTILQQSWVPVPIMEGHFSWNRAETLQITVDFAIKAGLWLRLVKEYTSDANSRVGVVQN